MSLTMNSGWIRVSVYCNDTSGREPIVKWPNYLAAPPVVGDHIEGYTKDDDVGIGLITHLVHVTFNGGDNSITPGYRIHVKRVGKYV